MNEFTMIIRQGESEWLPWDFYEDAENVDETSERTVPGHLVRHFLKSVSDEHLANRALGLLTTFVARRSLVCWFVYCVDEQPLLVADRLLESWIDYRPNAPRIDESWCVESIPMENGVPIRDCRREDTSSAASAVAHAARFAAERSPLDAITSLSHAFIAFDVSPVAGVYPFMDWIGEFAAPCAIEGRAMSPEEEWALADFEIPEVMLRRAE